MHRIAGRKQPRRFWSNYDTCASSFTAPSCSRNFSWYDIFPLWIWTNTNKTLENDDKQVHDLDTENETSTPVTTNDSNAYNNLHTTASSAHEQAHASPPSSASIPNIAPSLDDPHSLAISALTIAQTPQDNEERLGERIGPLLIIGPLFFLHVAIAVGVGVFLNLTTTLVIGGPLFIGAILAPVFFGYLSDIRAVSRILLTARRNNTLESYKDSARTIGEGIELPVIACGSMSRSTSPARSAFAWLRWSDREGSRTPSFL